MTHRLTEVVLVDAAAPSPVAVRVGADVIHAGGIVAFPTETVYGLGANALDVNAVLRVFHAKGRPTRNPLIVHVLDAVAAHELAACWPDVASRLCERFWPGPLTLVLARSHAVPDQVTAGGSTVAVRAPAHPVARALLAQAGVPLGAPSANRSTRISPTRADHVLAQLNGRIDLIIDAGPTPGGLESTVLDLTAQPPVVLRPGPVTQSQIELVIGPVTYSRDTGEGSGRPRSPGLLGRHYAPLVPVVLASDEGRELVLAAVRRGERVGWLQIGATSDTALANVIVRHLAADARCAERELYAALHELEQHRPARIIVSAIPTGEEWAAVTDRLHRASG